MEPKAYFQSIKDTLSRNPEACAIEDNGIWYSWQAVNAIAERLDAVLTQAGFGQGTRIGLVARNRMPHIACLWGLLATRRSTVMIYSAMAPDALAKELEKLALPVVLADSEDWTEATIAACAKSGTLALRPSKDPEGPIAVVAEAGARNDTEAEQTAPGVAIEMLSSGTTGAPKRIPISWRTLQMASEDAAANFPETGHGDGPDGQAAPLVQPAPLANIGGLYLVVPAGVSGWPLALIEKFSVSGWLDTVKRVRPKVSWLAPAAIKALWDANVRADDLGSLVGLRTGSAPLNPQLQDDFEAKYGLAILLAYGATEFCGVIVLWTLEDHASFAQSKRGSTGRARPGVELRVRGAEDSRILGPGEIGILEIRVARLDSDWIVTTDLASIDEDGFLFLHGRADDAINRGGFKVMPAPIAEAICQHPQVCDAVVVGITDERLGQIPVAAVVLADDAELAERELKDFLRASLLSYQIPAKFAFVPFLPRNASLKVDRPAVQALFA